MDFLSYYDEKNSFLEIVKKCNSNTSDLNTIVKILLKKKL